MTVIDEIYSDECIFPFVYQGVTYNECAWDGYHSVYWCSILNDIKGESIKGGNCGSGCPTPKEDKCTTKSDEDCIFPFKFNNKTYYECTWDYSNTAWCSTKVDKYGVHVGGSKGHCNFDCRIKPKNATPKKFTSSDEYYDVLKDIFFKDLSINISKRYDKKLEFVCANAYGSKEADVREEVMSLLKDKSSIRTYRQLCEDPVWNGLRGVIVPRQDVEQDFDEAFCRGHRPSQIIRSDDKCDGVYSCIDRSDETECVERINHDQDIYKAVWLSKFEKQAKFDVKKVIYHQDPIKSPLSNDSKKIKFQCYVDYKSILIGDKNFDYMELCSNMLPEDPYSGHQDHISFCQNHTFWKSCIENDTDGIPIRPWRGVNDKKIYACTGNYPGFSLHYPHFPPRFHYLKPGCRDEAFCPDNSDIICPTNNTFCDSSFFFTCKDNLTCIPSNLVCDGFLNCKDGSDEDQGYCLNCPLRNGDGHPFRPKSKKYANTFSCTHRYTGKPICASPCDGRDDLCKGFADEMGCDDEFLWWNYLLVGVAAVSFLGLFFRLCELMVNSFTTRTSQRGNDEDKDCTDLANNVTFILMQLTNLNQHQSSYAELRLKKSYGASVIASIQNKDFEDRDLDGVKNLQDYCRQIYKMELDYNDGNECITNLFFFDILGTSHPASVFFTNIDNGWFFRKKEMLLKISYISALTKKLTFIFSVKTLSFMIIVLAYYLDLFKDILLAHRLYTFLPDWLPIILFTATVATVTLGELANIIVVLNYKRWSVAERLFGALFIFLVPAITSYQMFRLECKFQKSSNKEEKQNILLSLGHLKKLKSKLRGNENIFEHFPQLVILVLLILIKKTNTSTVSLYLSKNLIPDNEMIFFASALGSFLSLLRGQLFVLHMKKGGFLPMIGQIILFSYFALGIFARVSAILLFFSPNLGLLNLLFHDQLASLDAYWYIFDVDAIGRTMYFGDIWRENYMVTDHLYNFPEYLLAAIFLIIVVMHLIISQLIKRKYFKGIPQHKKPIILTILDDIRSILTPPLHFDWELIYRNGRSTGISINECWSRSKKILAMYNLLIFLEHIILLIPLMTLKYAIDERNRVIMEDFPPNADEQLSTYNTNCLILCGLMGYSALPFVSFTLSYMYFKWGHAWSRILKKNM